MIASKLLIAKSHLDYDVALRMLALKTSRHVPTRSRDRHRRPYF